MLHSVCIDLCLVYVDLCSTVAGCIGWFMSWCVCVCVCATWPDVCDMACAALEQNIGWYMCCVCTTWPDVCVLTCAGL